MFKKTVSHENLTKVITFVLFDIINFIFAPHI